MVEIDQASRGLRSRQFYAGLPARRLALRHPECRRDLCDAAEVVDQELHPLLREPDDVPCARGSPSGTRDRCRGYGHGSSLPNDLVGHKVPAAGSLICGGCQVRSLRSYRPRSSPSVPSGMAAGATALADDARSQRARARARRHPVTNESVPCAGAEQPCAGSRESCERGTPPPTRGLDDRSVAIT